MKRSLKENAAGSEIQQNKGLVWGHRRLGDRGTWVHPSIFPSFWLNSSSGSTLQVFRKKLDLLSEHGQTLYITHTYTRARSINERRVTVLLTQRDRVCVSREPLQSLSAKKWPLSKKPHSASLR